MKKGCDVICGLFAGNFKGAAGGLLAGRVGANHHRELQRDAAGGSAHRGAESYLHRALRVRCHPPGYVPVSLLIR